MARPIGTVSVYHPLAATGRHLEQDRRQAGKDRHRQERDPDREAVGDALALEGDGDPEEDGRELDHHEDAEQAERRALAEVNELDDPAQEQPGDRQPGEGPREPEPNGKRHRWPLLVGLAPGAHPPILTRRALPFPP